MVLSQGWFKIDFVIHYQISRLDPAPDRKPDVLVKIPDPDPDPTKRSGADRMRTPNTVCRNRNKFWVIHVPLHWYTLTDLCWRWLDDSGTSRRCCARARALSVGSSGEEDSPPGSRPRYSPPLIGLHGCLNPLVRRDKYHRSKNRT